MPYIRILNIGTLSKNDCLPHDTGGRTAHATTTYISSGEQYCVVDPGLPKEALHVRLHEQTGLTPDKITDVFLTSFRPSHRRGLDAFPNAKVWISHIERETAGQLLIARFIKEQEQDADSDLLDYLRTEIATLQQTSVPEDTLLPNVDLFPLPGYTPGTCGLLITQPAGTTLLCGDAVATQDHIEHGRVLKGAFNLKQAQESMTEAVEIADWIIPGHGNLCRNPAGNMNAINLGINSL